MALSKSDIKHEIRGWGNILFGSVIMAFGFVFFINPYNIVGLLFHADLFLS